MRAMASEFVKGSCWGLLSSPTPSSMQHSWRGPNPVKRRRCGLSVCTAAAAPPPAVSEPDLAVPCQNHSPASSTQALLPELEARLRAPPSDGSESLVDLPRPAAANVECLMEHPRPHEHHPKHGVKGLQTDRSTQQPSRPQHSTAPRQRLLTRQRASEQHEARSSSARLLAQVQGMSTLGPGTATPHAAMQAPQAPAAPQPMMAEPLDPRAHEAPPRRQGAYLVPLSGWGPNPNDEVATGAHAGLPYDCGEEVAAYGLQLPYSAGGSHRWQDEEPGVGVGVASGFGGQHTGAVPRHDAAAALHSVQRKTITGAEAAEAATPAAAPAGAAAPQLGAAVLGRVAFQGLMPSEEPLVGVASRETGAMASADAGALGSTVDAAVNFRGDGSDQSSSSSHSSSSSKADSLLVRAWGIRGGYRRAARGSSEWRLPPVDSAATSAAAAGSTILAGNGVQRLMAGAGDWEGQATAVVGSHPDAVVAPSCNGTAGLGSAAAVSGDPASRASEAATAFGDGGVPGAPERKEGPSRFTVRHPQLLRHPWVPGARVPSGSPSALTAGALATAGEPHSSSRSRSHEARNGSNSSSSIDPAAGISLGEEGDQGNTRFQTDRFTAASLPLPCSDTPQRSAVETPSSDRATQGGGEDAASPITTTGEGAGQQLLLALRAATDVRELRHLVELHGTAFGPDHVVMAFEVLAGWASRPAEREEWQAPGREREQGGVDAAGDPAATSSHRAEADANDVHSDYADADDVQVVARCLLDIATPLLEGDRMTPRGLLALLLLPRRLGLVTGSGEMLVRMTKLLPYVTALVPEQLLQLLEALASYDMWEFAPSSGTVGRVLFLRAHRALSCALPYMSVRQVARGLGAVAALAPAGVAGLWEKQAQRSASREWRTDWTVAWSSTRGPAGWQGCEAQAEGHGAMAQVGELAFGGSGLDARAVKRGVRSAGLCPGATSPTAASPAVAAARRAAAGEGQPPHGGSGVDGSEGPRVLGRRMDAAFKATVMSCTRAALARGDVGPEDAVQLLYGIARFKEWPGRAGLACLEALRPGRGGAGVGPQGRRHPLEVGPHVVCGGTRGGSAIAAAAAVTGAPPPNSSSRGSSGAAFMPAAARLPRPDDTATRRSSLEAAVRAGFLLPSGSGLPDGTTAAPAAAASAGAARTSGGLVRPLRRAVVRCLNAGQVELGGAVTPHAMASVHAVPYGTATCTAPQQGAGLTADQDTTTLLALIDLLPTPPEAKPPRASAPSSPCETDALSLAAARSPVRHSRLTARSRRRQVPTPAFRASPHSQPNAVTQCSRSAQLHPFLPHRTAGLSGKGAAGGNVTAVCPSTAPGAGRSTPGSMKPMPPPTLPSPLAAEPAGRSTVSMGDIAMYGTTLWTLVRLGVRPSVPWVGAFMTAVQPRLADMDAGLLTRVWWALCKVRWAPTPAWRAALMDALAAAVPLLQPDQVCMILGGFGSWRYRPQRTWMEQLLEHVQTSLRDFHATSCVALAVALARMDYRPRHRFLQLFLEHCRTQLPYMDGRHLVNLLWALRHGGLTRRLGAAWRAAYLDATLEMLLALTPGRQQQEQGKQQGRAREQQQRQERPHGQQQEKSLQPPQREQRRSQQRPAGFAGHASPTCSTSHPGERDAAAVAISPAPLAPEPGSAAAVAIHTAAVAAAAATAQVVGPRRSRASPLTPPQLALLLLYVARGGMAPGRAWRAAFWAASAATVSYMPPVALVALLNGVRKLRVAPPLNWARGFFAASAAKMESCTASCVVQLAFSLLHSPLRPPGSWVRAFRSRLEGVMSSLSRHQVGICMRMIRYVSWRKRWSLPPGWRMDTPAGTLYDSAAAGAAAVTAGRQQRGRRWWQRLIGARSAAHLRPRRGAPRKVRCTTQIDATTPQDGGTATIGVNVRQRNSQKMQRTARWEAADRQGTLGFLPSPPSPSVVGRSNRRGGIAAAGDSRDVGSIDCKHAASVLEGDGSSEGNGARGTRSNATGKGRRNRLGAGLLASSGSPSSGSDDGGHCRSVTTNGAATTDVVTVAAAAAEAVMRKRMPPGRQPT